MTGPIAPSGGPQRRSMKARGGDRRARSRGIRLAACFAAFGLVPAAGASAATFTVDSTVDQGDAAAGDGSCATAAGVCTLRAAIQEANALAGADTIIFDIPGLGPYTIAVSSALPIINQPLILNAQTQLGWTTTGPVVQVDGAAAPADDVGLQVGSGGDDSVIRGLMITRFGFHGILVASGADRVTIAGNWIGTTGTGSTGVGNGFRSAILGDGLVLGGSQARIGGPNAADRNVITNSRDEGIDIVRGPGLSGNIIQGNFIGVDPDGASGNGNGDVGIAIISGSGNTIGGLLVAERNVISRNFEGIEINTANNVVQGNYIGTDVTGTLPRGNRSDDGIEIQSGATGNTIGGTVTGEGNLIAFNALDGVNVVTGSGNAVLGNSIHSNGNLGIDLLLNNGVTPNDAGDGDAGGNDLLNFPVLLSGVASGGLVVGTFSLDVPVGSYRVEFFRNPLGADPSGNGEGQVFAGSTVVAHLGGGSRFFPYSFAGGVGDIVTTTATVCTVGCTVFGSTSEFGNALVAVTTAVELMSFEAVGLDGAVELRWRTGSELSNLGFHVYRGSSAGGPWTRVTSSMIPGLGSSPVGQSYTSTDGGLRNGVTYYYRLEDVDTASVSTFHGPVSAIPVAGVEPPPSGGGGGGGGGSRGVGCPSWVLASVGTESSGVVCTKHGDPEAVSFEVLSRGARGATLELRTGGFWAAHTLSGAGEGSGTVRVFVPGFDTPVESAALALPLRRALVSAVVGKKVRLVSAEALELRGFGGLRPSAVGFPEMAVGRDGTVRAGRRVVGAPRVSRGYWPRELARVTGTVFQGERKSAVVEMVPVRFDGDRQQLVLAGRVRVRLAFAGLEPGETGTGGTGRLRRKASPRREALVQLHTSGRGLYAVSFEEVFPGRRRGMEVGHLRLQRQGEAVGFRVEPGTGVFGPGSTLFFYADRAASSTDYSSEVAYELVRSVAGEGMGVVPGPPEGGSSVSSSRGFATFETNRNYQPGLVEAPDVWLWEAVAGGGAAKTVTIGLTGVDGASSEASRVTVHLQGGSASGVVEDHHVVVSLNGAVVGDRRFGGKGAYPLSLSVATSQLVEGANSLSLLNVGDTGVSSVVLLDKMEVEYPQAAVLRAGVFEGTWAEGGTVEVGGVVSSAVVLDVTSGGPARWVSGLETVSGSVRFRAEGGRRYVVVSREGWGRPRIAWPVPTTLRDVTNQADYLVIAPREFLGAAEPLLVRRESQGLRTKGVAFEEIAEVFGRGQPSGEAIREFVSYAYHSWSRPSPRYVVLVGDATSDPRRFQATSWSSPLPALWAKTSYLWTVSDPGLVAVNGEDRVPDLSIGRLPAQTVGEAEALVSKVLAWEESGQDLGGKAVLVADNPDAAGNFEADVEDIERSFLGGRETEVLKLRELGALTRGRVREAFDGGASLMSYVGHGGSAVWASENVWNSWDPPSLSAQSRQPLLLTMNCLNGYFVAPNFESLSEALLKAPGRGVVGAFSPSGLSLDAPAHQYHRAVMAELTGGQHERLGDAILAAQGTYAQSGLMPELLSVYHLLGDPGMKLR